MNHMKTKIKAYMESIENKNWMDKNLKPTKQSGFIREAVTEKIDRIKNTKKK